MKRYKKASDIKVGVVGYGGAFNMGKQHLEEMRAAGMTPYAVAEIDASRLQVATKDFPGIETYATVGEMLRKSSVDLVVIITPHNTHAPLALKCLKAGRHVVCEKPFAITTAECDSMIAAAKRSRVMLSTYHNRHWDGCILHAVKTIRSGAIGEVVRVEAHMGGWGKPGDWWRSSKSISGGIMYDWGVHLLEYSLQIVDAGVKEVTGFAHKGFWAPQTRWKSDANEDEGFLVARFDSGAWVSLCMSSIESNPKRGMVEITGTKGTYLMEGNKWTVFAHEDGADVSRSGWNPKSEGWRLYRNIAGHLTRGTPLVITPEWARRPIHIIDLGNRSAKFGQALKAKYR
jgi:predicted dehydrogenase